MVIVAAIAVSTMVSNHIVMPIAMRSLAGGRKAVTGDVRRLLLTGRGGSRSRVVMGLGFLYFWLSGGSGALASIGLIAFVGVAQFLPSLLGGLFWRGATRCGRDLTGLAPGFVRSGPTRCSCPASRAAFPAVGGGDRERPLGHRGAAAAGASLASTGSTRSGARGDLEPRRQHAGCSGGRLGDFERPGHARAAPGRPVRRCLPRHRWRQGTEHLRSPARRRAEDLFVLAQRILGV